mmetsp:Transcript_66816/g.186505  ORF Transcript_66816/g.186505 Transcript_66816/m.186505 type:complete len:536 (-) Transcript_66816:102-1709(-)
MTRGRKPSWRSCKCWLTASRTILHPRRLPIGPPRPRKKQKSGGFFGGLFGGSSGSAAKAAPAPPSSGLNIPLGAERGLYVWGGCGTGKTFMMDLFHESIPITKKRRVHFHEWMIEVHDKLHKLQKANAMVSEKANTTWTAEAAMAQRKALKDKGFDGTHGKTAAGGSDATDLVAQVAQAMMDEAWLLCFDEFQVTHISDAIIMKRLFSILFEKGAVIVATSNRPPEDLYLNGLNRGLFMPFIPMLKDRCDVHDIGSEVDYRLLSNAEDDDRRVYITPLGSDSSAVLERKFYRLCRNRVNSGMFVEAQGRRISVPKSGGSTNVAWFNFLDLCDKPLGAADYFAISSAFHTVFVANIPALTLQERDQVRRLITMVDTFYEKHTKVVLTAEKDPLTLFSVSEEDRKNSSFDEIFAWDRTASRLIEMQSVEYLSQWARAVDGEQYLGQFELTSLSEEDIVDMWVRYDKDGSGEIDRDECRLMLADVMEVTSGHRHVSDDLLEMIFADMDVDGGGSIDREEFSQYLRHRGLSVQRSSLHD